MRKLLMIVIAVLLMGCKSKMVSKEIEISKKVLKEEIKKDSTSQKDSVREKESVYQSEKKEKVEEQETEITVKGKVETNKPLELHEIKNGDTLQSIRIVGNAEVFIHSKNNISNNTKSEKSSESFTDKLKDFSQNIVKENNVKERVAEMKKRTQEVNTKTGTFWSFGLIGIFGVVALLIIGIIIYLKIKQ